MSEPYVGEIRIVGFNFAPEGWSFCQGQLLAIADYDTLFNLIGTIYGGDGQTTFALPNLMGRVPLHQGRGQSTYQLGEAGGVEQVTLNTTQIPSHTHATNCQDVGGTQGSPLNGIFALTPKSVYAVPGKTVAMGSIVAQAGGGQAHSNLQSFLTLSYIISLFGIYPSPN